MVSILDKKGLLQKKEVGRNGYRAKLLLTQEGKQAAEYVRSLAAMVVRQAGAGLSDSDREVFYRCLEQITANLQALSAEGLHL